MKGEGCRLYALLTPRLAAQGERNSASCEDGAFYAHGEGDHLSLRADVGFDRQSAGYVGRSDGLQDFRKHDRMTWTYRRAEDGNVAVIGELASNEGVLALSFGASRCGVGTLARSSLAEGFAPVYRRVEDKWQRWQSDWEPPSELSDN